MVHGLLLIAAVLHLGAALGVEVGGWLRVFVDTRLLCLISGVSCFLRRAPLFLLDSQQALHGNHAGCRGGYRRCGCRLQERGRRGAWGE